MGFITVLLHFLNNRPFEQQNFWLFTKTSPHDNSVIANSSNYYHSFHVSGHIGVMDRWLYWSPLEIRHYKSIWSNSWVVPFLSGRRKYGNQWFRWYCEIIIYVTCNFYSVFCVLSHGKYNLNTQYSVHFRCVSLWLYKTNNFSSGKGFSSKTSQTWVFATACGRSHVLINLQTLIQGPSITNTQALTFDGVLPVSYGRGSDH